jgi:hypothetical protein
MIVCRDRSDRPDPSLVAVGFLLAASAVVFRLAGPKGRVLLDLENVPQVAKGDVVVMGFVAAAGAVLVSRTRSTAVRRLIGLGFLAIAAAWTMLDHRGAGPVVASFGDSGHGLHRNDWLAAVPGALGLVLLLPLRKRSHRSA